jgi:RimJ/RimL family protein N-acetyltransferase
VRDSGVTTVLDTDRLRLRRLTEEDAGFVLELLNDPAFIANIGDRQVRSEADAVAYIARGPMASYERFGFGLYVVIDKASGVPAGLCGLVRRDMLPDVDIGFALLPAFRSRGFAVEAALAVKRHAADLGLRRLVAIALPSNERSVRVLERIGMRYERRVRLSDTGEELALYAADFEPTPSAGGGPRTPSTPDWRSSA